MPDWPATTLRCAAGAVDITPPTGIHLHNWAYSPFAVATGVHRPLVASVCAFETHSERALLVSLDLGWWMSATDESRFRGAVLAATGLAEEQVITALTHSHAGPSLSRADADRPGGELIAPYLDRIAEQVAGAATALYSRLELGLLEWSYGKCDLAVNRDLYLPNEGRYVVGANPMGESDDTLVVGRLSSAQGDRTIAVIVNYAAHPTSLGGMNSLISPDYLGAAREVVEHQTGATFLFLQGASGDLSPRRQYESDVTVADANGRVLAHAVLSTLAGMPAPDTTLRYRETIESGAPLGVFEVASAPHLDEAHCTQLDVIMETQENEPAAGGASAVDAERKLRADRIRENAARDQIAFPVTAWQLGPAAVFAYPGEAYSILQRRLRQAAPGRPVLVVNLANGGHQGYLAPRAAYAEGRYPAWQSPLAAGSLERLADACELHLSRLNLEESEQT